MQAPWSTLALSPRRAGGDRVYVWPGGPRACGGPAHGSFPGPPGSMGGGIAACDSKEVHRDSQP